MSKTKKYTYIRSNILLLFIYSYLFIANYRHIYNI